MITLISFIISVVVILLFISWKIWEDKTGNFIISEEVIKKSDERIIQRKKDFEDDLKDFSFKFYKYISISKIIGKNLSILTSHYKNIFIKKIIDLLGVDNIKNIERNKGSVSLFLRNISEDKKDL